MRVHLAEGNVCEAIRQYGLFKRLLHERLGIEPSAQIEQLIRGVSPVLVEAGVTSPARFALASLATWRVTHLLAEEDGPGGAVVRLRARLGTGQLGELMDCFYCLSIWVAAPFSLTVTRRRRDAPLVWLALSGAACLLERATTTPSRPPRPAGSSIQGISTSRTSIGTVRRAT